MESLSQQEIEFLDYRGEPTKSKTMNYINNEKAIEIILGILLSVVVAFTIGAIIQYVSRLLLSFKFEEKPGLNFTFSCDTPDGLSGHFA